MIVPSLNNDITYFLQLNDVYGQHLWEINLISEPKYGPKKHQYKFWDVGINIDYETNVLQFKIISKNELKKSILNRMVLIEKINNKTHSPISDDPLIEWSFQQMFSSDIFGDKKNLKLLKTNKIGKILNVWILSECFLLNSTIWTENYSRIIPTNLFNHTIWIKPNSILNF